MAKNNNLTDFVTDIADTIRAKCKITGKINPQDFSAFVGGMPFFKFRETADITATAGAGVELPLSYSETYIKGYVYLTNDNGLTETGEDSYGMVIANGFSSDPLFTINNTTDRIEISGYNWAVAANFIGFLSDPSNNGQTLIEAGWHLKIDIYEMRIGNPDGKNTKIKLNGATGGGV